MILALAILYILVVITAISLTRARKYANDWEETFKKEAMNHPDKVCPICKKKP